MKEELKIYTYIDEQTSNAFPNTDNQISIKEYTYTSQRMGSTSLSASIMYGSCLDKIWTGNEYVTFQGERYFIRQTPTSSKENTDARYKHELNFVSERIILDAVYFYDVVGGTSDRYASNSTKVLFYGDINELVSRLNDSLAYSNLDYSIVVDSGVTSKELQMSFEDVFISDALQEIFNQYELAYYFVGKVIHVGFTSNAIATPFKYGASNNLLSITKTNANYKVINRCTGVGSTENIPFYYPNPSNDRAQIEADGGTWITPCSTLMPPIYRTSLGAERFYNALNNTYVSPETGEYYEFENPYINNNPSEHKLSFDYIKPTIEGVKNASNQIIGEIADIAFDTNDNDNLVQDSNGNETANYEHPYFFIKLHKFDGTSGFNLFDQAIEGQEMVISMKSGICGACEFTIAVDTKTQENLVQVDANGNLVRDENGNVKFDTAIATQNDTINNEVWVAVKKDISTFGVIMPNATSNYKPSVGDTFVILNISLPQAYITYAENRLYEEIIKYMANNNSEKFNFSINFSRIYLENNPTIANQINENARLLVEYDNSQYSLYISTYTYKVLENEPLPEITVELSDTITINKNTLQSSIDSVKQEIMSSIGSIDFFKQGLKYFLRKDTDDIAKGLINFEKGLNVGDRTKGINQLGDATLRNAILDVLKSDDFRQGLIDGEGFGLYKESNGTSVLEVDKLLVRLKMIISMLEVRKLSYVGGDQVFSSAGSKITRVVDNGDSYRCYILADDGTTRTMNDWHIGDQAMCRTNNIKEGVYENVSNRYYWRLVVATGTETLSDGKTYNYVDLSNIYGFLSLVVDGVAHDCVGYDTSVTNDIPQGEDNIVQLGNQIDTSRQYAYIIYVSEQKRVDYFGINNYELYSHEIEKHSAQGGFIRSDMFEIISASGTGVSAPIVCDRGEWVLGALYGHYDRVSHDGTIWLCNVEKGSTTTEEPTFTSTIWIPQIEKGKDAELITLSVSSNVMRCNEDLTSIGGQTINIEAKTSNLSGNVVFTITPYDKNNNALYPITLSGSGNIRTLTSADWITSYSKINVKVELNGYSDNIFIYRMLDLSTKNDTFVGGKNLLREFETQFDFIYWGGDGQRGASEVDINNLTLAQKYLIGYDVVVIDENGKGFEVFK